MFARARRPNPAIAQASAALPPSVVRPLGFEPRTCGLRGEEKLSRWCCVVPLTWFFVRTGVHLVRPNPVYWHQFSTEFSTKEPADSKDFNPLLSRLADLRTLESGSAHQR